MGKTYWRHWRASCRHDVDAGKQRHRRSRADVGEVHYQVIMLLDYDRGWAQSRSGARRRIVIVWAGGELGEKWARAGPLEPRPLWARF